MFQKIRHYFKRRQALRLFADKFLFEPQPSPAVQPPAFTPSPTPQTTFVAQPMAPPAPPAAFAAPPLPQSQAIDLPPPSTVVSPGEEIIRTLEPMVQPNRAKMDVINRRLV